MKPDNEQAMLEVVKAARATVEDGVNTYEHVLDEEDIDYDECCAPDGIGLCGARPCQELGCIVDKLKRLKALRTALTNLDRLNP